MSMEGILLLQLKWTTYYFFEIIVLTTQNNLIQENTQSVSRELLYWRQAFRLLIEITVKAPFIQVRKLTAAKCNFWRTNHMISVYILCISCNHKMLRLAYKSAWFVTGICWIVYKARYPNLMLMNQSLYTVTDAIYTAVYQALLRAWRLSYLLTCCSAWLTFLHHSFKLPAIDQMVLRSTFLAVVFPESVMTLNTFGNLF